MELVKPQVFHVAKTEIDWDNLANYLDEVGATNYSINLEQQFESGLSGAEVLIEVMGRSCYRSFEPGLNKNVTKVREGNDVYIGNILDSKHGAVVEHGSDSYIFYNVSRVFTHELVRHRIGTAFSQESLRYVRLDNLKCWFPLTFESLPEPKKSQIQALWKDTFERLEDVQKQAAVILGLDDPNLKFKDKKKLTSAMRRLAPIGLATSIGFTANHRAMRWEIELRTSEAAEEEARLIFGEVFDHQVKLYPHLYQDVIIKEVDGLRAISFKNYKI